MDALAEAFAAAPAMAPRLSIATPFRRCAERVPPGGTIPRADCPAPPRAKPLPSFLPGIAADADDPRSVHLLALHDLTAPDPRGIALENVISSLRRVAELADDPTDALVDLSAALILRAERTQAPRDLLEAYEIAQKAVDRAPRNPSALYNRALALDRFGLVEETAEDWKAAIAADSTSAWADEARRRLGSLQAIRAPVPPRDDAPLADYARYAAEEPQGARELGMDRLLAEWGDAIQRSDAVRTDDRLRRAEALGTALLRRPGGDASLADMARAIREAAADSAAMRKLAEAHREYGSGRAMLASSDFATARAVFQKAASAATASPCLIHWSRVYLGAAQANDEERPNAVRSLGKVSQEGGVRYPALIGRARSVRAVLLGRDDEWEAALSDARESARAFSKAGERRGAATALSFRAEILFVLGESDSAYAAVHGALRHTGSDPSKLRKHNLLASMSDPIAQDGFRGAALRLLNEDVRATETLDSIYQAEARLRRARLLASLRETERAREDVVFARRIIDRTKAADSQDWLKADLNEAEAATVLADDLERQISALDSAAAYFDKTKNPYRALPQMVAAAEARLSAGAYTDAMRRFEAIIRVLEHRRESIRVEPRRAAVFDRARRVVDRIVMLKLRHGDPGQALQYMDRARASLAVSGGGARGSNASAGRAESRPGEIALVYSRVADTLLIWSVARGHVEVVRTRIDTLRFMRTLQELDVQFERGSGEDQLRPGLRELYDSLIEPVKTKLGPAGTPLVIVADGEFASVPFAALGHAQGEYLIESHPIRFAVSLSEAQRPPPVRLPGTELFIADPTFAASEFPLYDRLPFAAAEVRDIADDYPRPVVLAAAEATNEGMTAALRDATMLHIAAHAVFDDARPERSYLVFAPGQKNPTGRIAAAALAAMNLKNISLVVLSACTTARGGRERAAGYTGLTGALLAAGAGGVVGSMWDVDDRATATFMRDFHTAYRASGNPENALYTAQLAALRSDDARSRTPAVWAAFRYTGR